MSDLLDVQDLAEIYKTTPKGIHSRRSRSPETLPPAFKLGGKIVWRRSTVDTWIEDQERKQADLRTSDAA
jgi:predicted DNA-binding transcriptional regulator AlpA